MTDRFLGFALCIALVVGGAGCASGGPHFKGTPEGNAADRAKVSSVAVVGFLGNYHIPPDMSAKDAFAPDTPRQKRVEAQYRAFLQVLSESKQLRLVAHQEVAENNYYRAIPIPDEPGIYHSTAPAGLRKVRAIDRINIPILCENLNVDAVIFFECSYAIKNYFSGREAYLLDTDLEVYNRFANLVYGRNSFVQASGKTFFFNYFFFRKRTFEQDIYCTEKATRIIVEDMLSAF